MVQWLHIHTRKPAGLTREMTQVQFLARPIHDRENKLFIMALSCPGFDTAIAIRGLRNTGEEELMILMLLVAVKSKPPFSSQHH